MSELLTLKEAAIVAHTSRRTVNNWVLKGKLKNYNQNSKNILVEKEEVEKMQKEQGMKYCKICHKLVSKDEIDKWSFSCFGECSKEYWKISAAKRQESHKEYVKNN
jgi:hypothetical protein